MDSIIISKIIEALKGEFSDTNVDILVDPDGVFNSVVYAEDRHDGERFIHHKGDELPTEDQVRLSKLFYEKYSTEKRLNDEVFSRNADFISDIKMLSVDELFELNKKYISEFETNDSLTDDEKKKGLEEFYLVHYFITKYLENKTYLESTRGHILHDLKQKALIECSGDHIAANSYIGEVMNESIHTLTALCDEL